MKEVNTYDVIIIGAGPAGSSCATMLAQHGLSVLMIDKAKFPREKICGDCINPKCWSVLEVLGVAEDIRHRSPHEVRRFRITNSAGTTISGGIHQSAKRPFFSMKRSEFDTILLKHAQRQGVKVFEQTRIHDCAWTDVWDVTIQTGDIDEYVCVRGSFLIGADGRNSSVAQLLHRRNLLAQQKRGRKKNTRIAVQWHNHFIDEVAFSIEMFLFDSGYCGVVNVSEQMSNVALVTDLRHAQLVTKNLTAFFSEKLSLHKRGQDLFSRIIPHRTPLTTTPIDSYVQQSIHPAARLIGDAHTIVEPFTGEGVFFAMQEGVRSAQWIISRLSVKSPFALPSPHSTFIVNKIFSPVLKSTQRSDRLLHIGKTFPFLVPPVARIIFT